MTKRIAAGAITVCTVFAGCSHTQRRPHDDVRATGFGLFSLPATKDDALPQIVVKELTSKEGPAAALPSADIRDARRALAVEPVWLVPAPHDTICLVRIVLALSAQRGAALPPSVSRSCAPAAVARAGRLVEAQTLSPNGGDLYKVIGVAPDSVHRVVIRAANRTVISVPVTRGVYLATVVSPVAIEFSRSLAGHSRTTSIPLALPSEDPGR
jgi:hypothetical protein